MKTENELRELLHDVADSRSPSVGSWQRFQARRGRSRVRRIAVAVLAAGLGVGAGLSVPRLFDDRLPGPSAGPGYPVATYRDRILNHQFDYPEGWVREGAVGESVAVAPSQDALNGEGSGYAQSLFAVSVAPGKSFDSEVAQARSANTDANRAGASVNERPTEIDGRRAFVFTIRWPVTSTPTECENSGCRKETVVIDWSPEHALVVETLAVNDDYWAQHGGQGQDIVESIRRYEPPKDLYIPAHGTFSVGVAEDRLTDAVLRFMDARARGDGAEPWLSESASHEYAATGSGAYTQGVRLYPASGFRWKFFIASRAERSDGQALFEIRFDETQEVGAAQAVPIHYIAERIVFGPRTDASGGQTEFVVLSVTRAPECEAPPGAACL